MKVALLLLMTVLLTSGFSHADDMRIATVDIRKIFDKCVFSKKSELELRKISELLDKENNDRSAVIHERQLELDRISQKFKEGVAMMSAEDKTRMKDRHLRMSREVWALKRDQQEFLAQRNRKLFDEGTVVAKSILSRISEAVQVYAREKKFDMVIEIGGHSTYDTPLFLYLEGAVDISDEIIARLNKKN